MKKQFVTQEIALKLKEFGFDEKCFAIYDAYQDNRLVYLCEDGRNPSGTIKTNALNGGGMVSWGLDTDNLSI